jgi:polyketide cyclase/dehydrase/lipid transport protein
VAENDIEIDAPPERVWEVLAQPLLYDEWVLGAQTIRDADESWPAPGSKLHHRTGVGPLAIDDETRVVEADSPRRLVLEARVRPLGVFPVVLELDPRPGGGTHVRMVEEPDGALAKVPGTDTAIEARNTISLRRLKQLAEETTAARR